MDRKHERQLKDFLRRYEYLKKIAKQHGIPTTLEVERAAQDIRTFLASGGKP